MNSQIVSTKNTEVLNVGTQEGPVPTYQDFPMPLLMATGGWVGNQFITCGGFIINSRVSNNRGVGINV